MRVSATDWVDGGWDVAQTIELIKQAKALGIAYVCASSGGIRANVSVPVKPNYQVPFAEQIRKATGVITRAVGLITDAQQANDIIRNGQADLIAVARAVLDDPRWGWHAADKLGAKVHSPPQYAMARGEHWRHFRNDSAQAT
jgi:2,4-dienoyl-CoA reductase-like NADH-dependent reductase (Old Yellow Enzyme family)